MSESDYKNLINLLRSIVSDAINLKSDFHLNDGDIASILRKEAMAEDIITANYIKEDD